MRVAQVRCAHPCPGSRTDYFHIPGARENTWDYKSLEDGVELRERIIDLCEHADHTEDPNERRSMLTFVVVGGGYTGIELITGMRDFLFRYVAHTYRGIQASEIRLLVLEAAPDVLQGVGPKLAAHARKRLYVEGIGCAPPRESRAYWKAQSKSTAVRLSLPTRSSGRPAFAPRN